MKEPVAKTNFAKYLPIDTSGFKGIFKIEIFVDMSVLKLRITLLQIRNYSLFDKIAQGLNNNPENASLVEIIDSEVVYQREISQIETIAIKQAFEVKLNEYTSSNNSQIGQNLVLHGIIPGLNNLHLRYEHTYLIYTFMKFFIEEYETIKMSIRSMANINDSRPAEDGETENSDSDSDNPKEPEEEPAEGIAEKYSDCGGIFLEMMGIVGSQTIRSFIARNLFNKKWNLNSAVSINSKEGDITIKHYPLYDFNVWQYSSIHDKELVNLLNSLPENSDFEIADKLKRITKQIIYIIFNRDALIKQNHSKYVFTISVGLFLMYIYSLKMNSHHFINNVYTASTNNGKTYITMLNYAFRYVLEKFEVQTSTIRSIKVEYAHDDVEDTSTLFDPMVDNIDRIFQQYRYLASIDQNEFLNTVFSTANNSFKEPAKADASQMFDDIELAIGQGTVVKIDTFKTEIDFDNDQLTPEHIFKQTPASLMDYVDIPLNSLFKTNRIISYLYCQLLYIQYSGVNKKFIDIDEYTHPILKRYCNIIIDDIFKSINDNKLLAQNTTSTLQLYSSFIAPFIKNTSSTSYVSLMLLYQVVIPYIHDNFGITEFVDNFH